MTSRDWQADRRAVFDRDDHTCRHCGAVGDAADPTDLRTHPVGAVPLEGTVHESTLVTVCTDCLPSLSSSASADRSPPDPPASRDALFEHVRETTRTQGGAISDAASFASIATSLPTTIGDAEPSADGDTDAEPSADSDTAAEYRRIRQDVLLAVDVADAHLERLAAIDDSAFDADVGSSVEAFDADVGSSVEAFSASATDLQSTLRTVVDRAETVPVGLERCHGCFGALEDGRCSTCRLEARETTDWERESGDLALERLFSAINDELQAASTTTEDLTDRATALAAQLSDA
ncbi:HNH endonuclease [Natronorubrum sp. FCH18a]|uniref:HNH endonuclease n=1 Tax=Natronorubrum sp. FCH18a TaxID=3447018 RepID=UPI003F50E9EE